MASECARADVAERRRIWINRRQPRMRRQPYRLVFIDETSVNTKMTRLRGRTKKGKRLKASAPFGKWGTQTFIAGLRHDALTAPWVIPGAMDRDAFNIYIETQLAPTLAPAMLSFSIISQFIRAPRPKLRYVNAALGCSSCLNIRLT